MWISLGLSYFGFAQLLKNCRFVFFAKFGTFQLLFLQFFSAHPFHLFFQHSDDTNVRSSMIIPWVPEAPFFFFFFFFLWSIFSLSFRLGNFCYILSSSLLILFSVISVLLLIPSTGFFILVFAFSVQFILFLSFPFLYVKTLFLISHLFQTYLQLLTEAFL